MSNDEKSPKSDGRVRVLIVDDNPSFRRELRLFLESSGDIKVIGEAENGLRGVELTENRSPDVVLMDQNMPSLSGVEATKRIKASQPRTRVIFIAAERWWENEAIRAGAERFFLKDDDLGELLRIVRDPMGSLRPLVEQKPQSRIGNLWKNKWLWRTSGVLCLISYLAALVTSLEMTLVLTALFFGIFFFVYGLKYYLSVALILFATSGSGNGNANGNKNGSLNGRLNGWLNGKRNGRGNGKGINGKRVVNGGNGRIPLHLRPFVSIHLPLYNEIEVVDRLLTACTSLDYENYEIIVADDSTDETTQILHERWESHPRVKISHRVDRSGFKGGALKVATQRMDPQAEFVVVFDADFVPPPDILHQFLSYFYGINGSNGNHYDEHTTNISLVDDLVAVVQGYQWHMLNASENWITRGVRSEFSGSYVIERSGQEMMGSMKMISGSVFMIRADVLRQIGWKTSITEDWELTLRLYLEGYKVLYTPFIQAPAECVATFAQLTKQRMRWAEGHTFNVKKYFLQVLSSTKINLREKLEFLYYAPYYLQSVLFLLGTGSWLVSDFILKARLPFWTKSLGWSLVFVNAFSLVLMNLSGLFLERGVRRNWKGLLSFVLLTFLLVPYQAYAAIKGLIELDEGGWHRTQKTGVITEVLGRLGMRRHLRRLRPKKKRYSTGLVGQSSAFTSKLMERLGTLVGNLADRVGLPTAKLERLYDRVRSWIRRLIPQPFKRLTRRIGLRARVAFSLAISLLLLLIFSARVLIVKAAPDIFYLRGIATNGASPAGQDMNNDQGSSEDTLLFDEASDPAYWYTDITYPTGGDDASIAAGNYTLNTYFDQLPQLPVDWYDANWYYRKKITIDAGLVSADQSNFPVLISLPSDTELAADAQDDGDDILFTSSNGTTKLSHEVEYFNDSTGELQAWVKVTNLSSSSDTELYMYYGNATTGSQENVSDVWSNGYLEVWHLDETSGNHIDSTSNNYVGTPNGNVTQDAAGQINGADEFVGPSTTTYITLADGDLANNAPFSISAWFQIDTSTTWTGIVTKGRELDHDWVGLWANGTQYLFGWQSGIGGNVNGSTLSLDTWYYGVATFDGTNRRLYLNDQLDAGPSAGSYAGITGSDTSLGNDLYLGTANTFDGFIDEVRISSGARTLQWISTEYYNQANQGVGSGKFIKTLGSEEAAPRVQITVSVYDTQADGGDAQEIITTSSPITIDSNTPSYYELDIGSTVSPKTFPATNPPRRLSVYIQVTEVYGSGSFTLAYDSASSPSSLDTPSLTIPGVTVLLLAVVVLIPVLTSLMTRKRRLTVWLLTIILSLLLSLTLLAQQVFPVSAAPDKFYLRDTTTNGASPAGQDMNLSQGSSEDTILLDATNYLAYWYTDITYPTGEDDASIAAGDYTLNMHFDQLPGSSTWWDASYGYRKELTITADTSDVPSGYSVSLTFNHAFLVSSGYSQSDGDDIAITYWNGSGWVELDRILDPGSSWNTASTTIWFHTQTAISATSSDSDYDLYYGNPSVAFPPADGESVFYFYDGFESGDLSVWDDIVTGSGDSISVDDFTVHTGGYAAEAYVDDGTQAAVENSFAGQQTLLTSIWVYLPPTYNAGSYIDLVQYYTGGSTKIASLSINTSLQPYIENFIGSETYTSDTALTTGAWHRLEMKIKISDTDGKAELWQNGVKRVDEPFIDTGTEDIDRKLAGISWKPAGSGEETIYIDDTFDRLWLDSEPTTGLGLQETPPSVDIEVSVALTEPDGTEITVIATSSIITIDATTTNPYPLDIGPGIAQTFSDQRILRLRIEVDDTNNNGSFTLAYDSSAKPSSLDTPSLTIFDVTILLLFVAVFIPIVTSILTRKRRLATWIVSILISLLIALSLLSQQVLPVSAAPDTFYLHDTDTSGITPAGEYMNTTAPTAPTPPEEFPSGPNYRSIGTNTGTIYSDGKASIDSGTTTVTFSNGASLPASNAVGAAGVGDKLVIGSETFFILSRDDATHVTVQNSATSTHNIEDYTITRAYNTFQAWEDPCGATPCLPTSSGGRGGNLAGENRIEVGVAYKDGAFTPTAQTLFQDSTPDATYYMRLTVAPGQRHDGTAGTGVYVNGGSIASGHVFFIRDPYVRIEWLEIGNYPGNTVLGQPINVNEGNAGNNFFSHLLIHDYTSTGRGAINIYENVTIRNSIFYKGDTGIRTYSNTLLHATLENVTVYGMTGDGVFHTAGTITVKNTISVGNGDDDFDLQTGTTVSGDSGYNLYSTWEDQQPGSNNQSPPASLEDLFLSIVASSEDLHLEPGGHDAIDNGTSLSGSFTVDIDNQTRPYRAEWDIGADEHTPYMRFDTVDQDVYWSTDLTYPTGGEGGSIAAGDYSLNIYFDKLPATGTSVSITVTVSRTPSGGTPATPIVSTSTTIDSSTTNFLKLTIAGDAQTFDPGADERLQVRIHVDSIIGGGSFALAYDTATNPSSLDTPNIVITDVTLLLVAVVILIPVVMNLFMKKRRLAIRIASFAISLVAVLAILGQQVLPTSAAPDIFYLHDTDTPSGVTWYDIDWSYRKKITIYASQVSDDLSYFPVLINQSTDAELAASAQTDGGDILFTSANGITKLDHEIEKFIPGTGELVAWVEVPSLSGSVNTELYMYYGNATVADQWNINGTWDTNYGAVWHLKETTGGSGAIKDSTSNNNHGTDNGVTLGATGIMDGATSYDGDSDYITVPSPTNVSPPVYFTASAWIKANDTDSGEVVSRGDSYVIRLNAPGEIQFSIYRSGSWVNKNPAGREIPNDGEFHYIACGVNETGSFYTIDGVNLQQQTDTDPIDYSLGPTVEIGRHGNGSTSYDFSGSIDEVRISIIGRSDDWIATEYNNQSSPSSFYGLDTQETPSITPAGKYMNNTSGSGAATMVFDSTDDEAYWYTELTYPTGEDNASIAAGDYTLNMYFDQLPAAWYDSAWSSRKQLTIDSAMVETDFTTFPVLVSMTDADLVGNTQGDGGDILFTSSNGTTKLDHEIESFNSGTGELVAWVEVTNLSSISDTDIYMYYGNAGASDQWNVAGTWDSNYIGVWHLDESGAGDPDEYQDSSQYLNHGQGGEGDSLFTPARVGGQIGYGQDFNIVYAVGDASVALDSSIVTFGGTAYVPLDIQNGDYLVIDPGGGNEESFTVASRDSETQVTVTTNATSAHTAESYILYNRDTKYDLIDVGNADILDAIGDEITLEAWVQHNASMPPAHQVYGILNHKGWSSGYSLWMYNDQWQCPSGEPMCVTFNLPGDSYQLSTDTLLSGGTWHHVVATYDGALPSGNMRIFIDGVEDTNTLDKTGDITAPSPPEDDVWIGHGDQPKDVGWSGEWVGQLDEVRISNVARPIEWIQTSHDNQDNQGTGAGKFIKTLGAVESAPTVDIVVSVYHTATDGTFDPVDDKITSTTKTIDANTANLHELYALPLGAGAAETFTSADPRRLRVHIDVTTVSGGGSFTLAYDSAADPSSLDTPSIVIPELTILLTALVILIPILTALLTKKRRLAIRLMSVVVSLIFALSLLSQQVLPTSAAPDVFYLHDTAVGSGSWYDPDWSYRQKITIDSTEVSGTADLSYFPVLINRTETDWADTGNGGKVVQSDGGDILFTAGDGTTKLDHEIERYTNTSGELIAWVEVPTVSYNSDTDIYIYYGNSTGVPDQWNINGTWDEGGSQNFRGVWHLKEDSGSAVDSTSYGTSGTVTGTVTRQSTGAVGYAYDYGTNGQVNAGDPGDGHLDFDTNSFTVSIWLNVDQSTTNYQLPLSKGGWSTSPPGYAFEINQDGNGLQFEISDGSTYISSPVSGISFDTWYYVTGVVDKASDRIRLYVDGSEIGSGTDISSVTSVNSGEDLEFAYDAYDLDGLLDEVRIAYSARTPGWIATEHSNQDSPSTFFKPLGSIETPGVSPAGKIMNTTLGSGAATMVFDSTDDEGYWYTDLTYPTGDDDAGIAAGDYKLNMYFDQLPTGGANWYDTDWSYRKKITIDNTKVSGTSDLSYFPVLVSFSQPTLTLTRYVTQSTDDAEEVETGGVPDLISSDLELVYDGTNQTVGIRFQGITIPQGATIINAYVQFAADNVLNNADPSNVTLHGELSTSAATFEAVANNITGRPTTTASVSWSFPTWVTDHDQLPAQRTPDISNVIEEIVGQVGWSNGNALVLMITGEGRREAESWNGANGHLDLTLAPRLTVEYVTGSDTRDSDLRDTSNGGYVAQADGGDILFTDSNGTKLDHEIEKYDNTTGELVAWVEVPTVSYDSPTDIYIYYGNASVADQWNITGTWDEGTADNYKGVWHLDEDAEGTGTADLYQDSTSHANHADDLVSALGQGGQINGGQEFDGVDDEARVPDPGGAWEFSDGGLDAGTSDFTISAWVSLSSLNSQSYPTILAKGGGSSTSFGYWFNYQPGAPDSIDLRVSDGTNRFIANSSASIGLTRDDWEYVTVVFDREPGTDTAYFYFNGSSAGSESSSDIAGNSASGTQDFAIADSPFWMGSIDEVRIADTTRTSDWVATEFNNQSSPSTFYNVLSQETPQTGSVDITVSVYHTKSDGSDPLPVGGIVSTSVTIDANTANLHELYALPLGAGEEQIFDDPLNPRRLQVHIDVTAVTGIGSFTLAYDSAADPSSLDTPSMVIPEWGLAFLLLVPLVPYLMSAIWRRRRLAGKIGSVLLGISIALGILANQVAPVSAAPDIFYLHADATTGLDPAGEYMNTTMGSGGLDTGSGSDGSASISGSSNINSDIIGSSRVGNPDGIATTVTANPTGTSITVSSSTGFAADDEILLISLRGWPGDTTDVGNYEFLEVDTVPNSTTINVKTTIQNSYDGSNFANQRVVVQRVPQWTSVTINSGGTLTASDFTGSTGGIVAFRATGAVTISGGGVIDGNGLGLRGGFGVTGSDVDGYSGLSITGWSAQGPSNQAGGGGGGDISSGVDTCGEGGAGGGYGSAGSIGTNNGYGTLCSPNTPVNLVGATYGVADLSQIFLGSGGGSGGNDADASSGTSGDGGDGAGIILIYADTISVTGRLQADGDDGAASTVDWTDNGTGGGGSGGSVFLAANSVTLGASSTTAVGGSGGGTQDPSWNGEGGDGGDGRIRIEADSISGTTNPTASTAGTPGGGSATKTFNSVGSTYWYADESWPTGDDNATIATGYYTFNMYFDSLPDSSSWYGANWAYRKQITVQNSQVDDNLTNFPVYVDLADLGADFFSNVNADGGDIRVTNSDGTTEMAREIVAINTGAQTGELHFKADSLSSSINTSFYIYYGNSGASDYAFTATYGRNNVWSNSYGGVWHLEEEVSGTGTANLYVDSTGNGYDGDDQVSATGQTGRLGNGQELDGLDDFIDMGDVLDFVDPAYFALEAWIRPTIPAAGLAVSGTSSHTTYEKVPSVTFQHTTPTGTNRLLLVAVTFNNNGYETVSSVTYNSDPLTYINGVEQTDDARVEIWAMVAPDVGTDLDVLVTFSTAPANILQGGVVGAVTFTGAEQVLPDPLDFVSANAYNDPGPATVNVTSTSGELVFAAVACEQCTSLTPVSMTEHWNDVNLGTDFGAAATKAGETITTMSWTLGTPDHWAIGAIPIRPSATGLDDQMTFIGKWGGTGSDRNYRFEVETDATLTFLPGGGVDPNLNSTTVLTTDTWYHAAVSVNQNSNVIRLRLNGTQEDADTAWTGAIGDGTYSFNLGRRSDVSQWFDGNLDEVRVSSTNRVAGWNSTGYNNQNSTTSFYSVASQEVMPSVDITVYVHHTKTDGTIPQLITSASTTISSSTLDPLIFDLGEDVFGQTFTSADPQVLRLEVKVTAVNGGGSFVLDYDGPCTSNQCSSLDTPVVVVPENALIFVAVVMLIPLVVGGSRNKNWLKLLRKRISNVSSRCGQILASQIGRAGQRVARLPRDDTRSE